MKVDIKHDLATLTTINELAINRLFDKINWCISDAIENAILNKENFVEVDLGFGILEIKFDNESVGYKFKPSKALDKSLINTIINEKNDLAANIENTLVTKITNIYKDLI